MKRMVQMVGGRRYDLWWEDPFKYAQHLRQSGECQVYFTFTNLHKYGINPHTFMRQNFYGMPWKCYVKNDKFAYLIDYTCRPDEIAGCWPVWSYQNWNLAELKFLVENPWSEIPFKDDIPYYQRPAAGQKHRIFIGDMAVGRGEIEKNKRRKLTKIQREYPEVEFFIKPKSFSMSLLFGCGFTAGCLDPYRERGTRKGVVYFPNGTFSSLEYLDEHKEKIEYFGYKVNDIKYDQDIGLLYTIASIRHAAHHWDNPHGILKSHGSASYHQADYHNPDMYALMPSREQFDHFKKEPIKDSDKILCSQCSLWRLCPAYREEAVCALPGTESSRLAKLAQSRNAEDVVEMLASVVGKQAERVEKRMDEEKFVDGGFDKEVDKMLNNLFKNGTQLAKLRDPSLGRPLVQINAQVAQKEANKQVAQSDPRVLAASIISDIEATGVKREDITEQMIEDHLKSLAPAKELESGQPLDAEVVDE